MGGLIENWTGCNSMATTGVEGASTAGVLDVGGAGSRGEGLLRLLAVVTPPTSNLLISSSSSSEEWFPSRGSIRSMFAAAPCGGDVAIEDEDDEDRDSEEVEEESCGCCCCC